MKKYLIKGMAVSALGLMVTACSTESDFTQKDAVSHAESVLGLAIDPNQDWKMTQEVTADISVNLGLGERYTVVVYDSNPLYNENATYYGKGKVSEGSSVSLPMSLPTATTTYYVAAYDSKFRVLVETASVSDGKMTVVFGGSASTRAYSYANRATEAEYAGTYAKTAQDYLGSLTVADMQGYTAFTNEDLSSIGNTLTNQFYQQGASYTYKVTAGDTGGTVTTQFGSITFNGTGNAAYNVTDYSISYLGFDALISRSSYTIVPSMAGKLKFFHHSGHSANGMSITCDGSYIQMWGQDFHNWTWNDAAVEFDVEAGKTYEVFLNPDDDGCFGMIFTAPSGMRPLGDGRHFRVASDTEITSVFHVNGNDDNQQPMLNGAVIYVEGKLKVGTNYTLNGVTIVVANGGELKLDGTADMSNYGRVVVLPGGKITGTSGSSLKVNNGAMCYNAGTIEFAGELNTNGSDFYNCGEINVTTFRNTSGGKITNFGKILAENNTGAADAYNCEFINACYWHYTGDAGIGHLTMLENSRLEVDGKAEFTQNHTSQDEPISDATPNILMANSVVKVGDCYATNTIFQGPTAGGEVGIVKITGKLMVGRAMDITQWGNCYFDWNSEEIYNKDGVKQTLAMEDGVHGIYSGVHARITKFITEASSPYVIPQGECTGDGYNPDGGGGSKITGSSAVYSYAFEDSWRADYDMNDVVVKVKESPNYDGKLMVGLCCTGASYSLLVYLNETVLFGGEVHSAFGVNQGMFVNTGSAEQLESASDNSPFVREEKGVVWMDNIDWPTDKSGAAYGLANLDLWVSSPEKSKISVATEGEDPHAVVIPFDWKWPYEYISIKDAYPDFIDFARDATHQTKVDWYKNPVESKVYTLSAE